MDFQLVILGLFLAVCVVICIYDSRRGLKMQAARAKDAQEYESQIRLMAEALVEVNIASGLYADVKIFDVEKFKKAYKIARQYLEN